MSNYIGDVCKHIVYRLLDTKELDHSGNREYWGKYTTDVLQAETAAKTMNGIEGVIAGLANNLDEFATLGDEEDDEDED